MAKDYFDDILAAAGSTGHSFNEKEARCRFLFNQALLQYGPFYHLHSPEKHPVIFPDPDSYKFAMSLVGICAYECPGVIIITFELMSNHVHFVVCGNKDAIRFFFNLFKNRLKKYLDGRKMTVDLSGFTGETVAIETLESLRNQICYTNRNNFVINPEYTPFSYPYGAGNCFFLPVGKNHIDSRFGSLTVRERRKMLHSHSVDYPDEYIVIDGYLSPASFCALTFGENVFRDARHYFFKISRDIESYKDVAEAMGEQVYYTDDELNAVIFKICKTKYGDQRATLLPHSDKIDVARTLHFDYRADNEKIARLLKMPINAVDTLFPTSRKD